MRHAIPTRPAANTDRRTAGDVRRPGPPRADRHRTQAMLPGRTTLGAGRAACSAQPVTSRSPPHNADDSGFRCIASIGDSTPRRRVGGVGNGPVSTRITPCSRVPQAGCPPTAARNRPRRAVSRRTAAGLRTAGGLEHPARRNSSLGGLAVVEVVDQLTQLLLRRHDLDCTANETPGLVKPVSKGLTVQRRTKVGSECQA
jgi:hypothetical protein